MNRELKFRFWSGIKMFYDLENVWECLKQQVEFSDGFIKRGYNHIADGGDFMQYTGLEDKNGNKIWESDLIKVSIGTEKTKEDTFKIVFINGAFQMESVNHILSDLCAFTTFFNDCANNIKEFITLEEIQSYFEVIGNIYENKELLNG